MPIPIILVYGGFATNKPSEVLTLNIFATQKNLPQDSNILPLAKYFQFQHQVNAFGWVTISQHGEAFSLWPT